MNTKNILTCIGLCIAILPHIYTMERTMELQSLLESQPLLEIKESNDKNYYAINAQHPFFKLPSDCLNRIIFSSSPQTIGALKNTCKYLASRASLLKLTPELMPYFRIPDDKTRQTFFKQIANANKAEYIEKILEYGKWEFKNKKSRYESIVPENAVIITMDQQEERTEREYLAQNYLPYLLLYAIQKNKYHAVYALVQNNADTVYNRDEIPLKYATRKDSANAIRALLDYNDQRPDKENQIDIKDIHDTVLEAWRNRNCLNAFSTFKKHESTKEFIKKETNKSCCVLIPAIGAATIVCSGIFIVGIVLSSLPTCHYNQTTHCINRGQWPF